MQNFKREYNRSRFHRQCMELPWTFLRDLELQHNLECGADYEPLPERYPGKEDEEGDIRCWRIYFQKPIYFYVPTFSKVENIQPSSHEKTLFVTQVETNNLTLHNPVGWEDKSITVEEGLVLENYSKNRQDPSVFVKSGFLSDVKTELVVDQHFNLGEFGAKGKLSWNEAKPCGWVKQFFQDPSSREWTCTEGWRKFPCSPEYD